MEYFFRVVVKPEDVIGLVEPDAKRFASRSGNPRGLGILRKIQTQERVKQSAFEASGTGFKIHDHLGQSVKVPQGIDGLYAFEGKEYSKPVLPLPRQRHDLSIRKARALHKATGKRILFALCEGCGATVTLLMNGSVKEHKHRKGCLHSFTSIPPEIMDT